MAAAAYGAIAVFSLFNAQTFTAEVSALVRGWWYATGAVTPYSAADVPADTPLYFYQVGYWQRLVGPGHLEGRFLSVLLGAISGLFLFSICRRLTANTQAAAAAAFIYLATPSTAFFFATATAASTLAALHLLAILILVDSLGRPRPHMSALMGIVCALMYFTRQEMLLGIVVLMPLYVAVVGRNRGLQALILLTTFGAVAALAILLLPAKFQVIALKLPLVEPLLGSLGLLGADYTLVSRGTHGPPGFGAALEAANLRGLFDSFVLPNLGSILVALALFAAARGPLKVLWAAPLYFLWLAVTHYIDASAQHGCEACMLTATPSFAGVGALAAALTLAASARWAKRNNAAPGTVALIGAVVIVSLNTFAPMLASHSAVKSFPRPMLDGLTAPPELAEIPVLSRWIADQIKTQETVLVIHGLGRTDIAALPYAVAAAGHAMPAESLDLKGTRRTINESLVGDMRSSVRAAIEADGLWNDEILLRWIDRDYNVIVFQDDPAFAALKNEIETRFDPAGTTRYRGKSIVLYMRKPA